MPDASVAVQISGTFGSRQEEAQRLGRILRPKSRLNQAHFYTLVSRDTVEQEFALKRQLFLCEQGYAYNIVNGDELELSVRSHNCLMAANIKTIGDLVRRDEQEMLKFRNFGRKSLTELTKILEEKGLHFGMDVDKYLKTDGVV